MANDKRRSLLLAIFLPLSACGLMLLIVSAGAKMDARIRVTLWIVGALMAAPSLIHFFLTTPFWPVDPVQDEDDELTGP